MSYGIEIVKNGAVIRQSKNLRGMRDYARVSPVASVTVAKDAANEVRGVLTVVYADGATSSASFASYSIMVDWVRNRRTWRGATIDWQGPKMGYLTRPGIIAGGSE